MTIPDYVLIGHLTADLTPNGRLLGGTVSYAARTIHALGLKVGVLTSAAADEPLLAELEPYVAELVVIPGQATSTFENVYTPEGRIQYIRGVAEKLTPAQVPIHWHSAPLVHLAPLTDEVAPRIAALFPHSFVGLTLQGWLRWWKEDGRVRFKPWFDAQALKHIDLVVFSEEDIPEAPHLENQFAQTVEHLFVTRAEKGGTYYHHGQPHSYTTPQVTVVNPTGAGDVFAAALLCGLHLFSGNMVAATQLAARLAANCVTRIGLLGTPTAAEAQQALEEIAHEH